MARPGSPGSSRLQLGPGGLLCLLPGLLGLVGVGVAQVLPEESVLSQVAISSLLAAPPFIAAAWIPWAMAVGLWRRRVVLPLLCACLGLWGMGRPIGCVVDDTGPPDGRGFVLAVVNVNSFPPEGTDDSELVHELVATDADVVVLVERRPMELPGYVRAADNFDAPMERISHASAVFCREGLECAAEVTPEFGSDTQTMPLALVDLPGVGCLMGMHGPPPVPYDPTGLAPHVAHIAEHIEDGRLSDPWGPCTTGSSVILAGDLNQVPGSRAYRALVGRGLVDVLDGVGLFGASWPAGGGWWDAPYFRLDQILVGPGVRVGGLVQRRFDGADHKGRVFWVAPG